METRIAASLAKAKTHVVVSTFSNGDTRRHETSSQAQAENYAIGERRLIGRNLVNRESGETRRIISVEIMPIA